MIMETEDYLKYWGNDEPICPHCDEEMDDAWELEIKGDGGECETDCPSCGKPMMVVQNLTVTYTTSKITE